MKRIDIYYGGDHYSLGGRGYDDLRKEIEEGMKRGPYWLEVNDGEGQMRAAHLLLTPGVALAIVPVPDENPGPSSGGTWAEGGPPHLG